jgi:hypothetical protein
MAVRAHSGDWSSEPVYTGSAPEIGPFACVLNPPEPGHYMLTVDGLTDEAGKSLQLEARVHFDRKRAPLVEFVYSKVTMSEPERRSGISGRVIGGINLAQALVRLTDDQAQSQERALESDGSFAFTGLAAGLYTLEVVGHPEIEGPTEVALDGQNQVPVELLAPLAPVELVAERTLAQSVIAGLAPHAGGQVVRLHDALGNEQTQVVGFDDRFHFANLPAGRYSLAVDAGYAQTDLQVDGQNGWEVEFAELVPTWTAEVARAGSMPGYSVVRVEVEGMVDLPVHIWKEEWEGMMRRTGSKPALGEYALEFSPLGPGHYIIEPEGLEVWCDVDLTGLEVLWVNFRRRATPAAPNLVRPYSAAPAQVEDREKEPVAGKGLYLLVASTISQPADLTALLRYVAQKQPQVGDSLEEALKASRVLIVGDDEQTCQRLGNSLRAALVAVECVSQNIAQRLTRDEKIEQ